MSILKAKSEFDRSIGNVIISYRFFSRTLPPEALFKSHSPVRINGTEFERYEQALAMLVELGWASFCRMDACLEALINRVGITPRNLYDYLKASGEFSDKDIDDLRTARELRNIFHHGDGDGALLKNAPKTVRLSPEKQPHLYPEHIENFYSLFNKAGRVLGLPKLRAV